MPRIDLNVDLAEGFPLDRELLEIATSANVCCGEHAGNWDLTQTTVDLCQRLGVRVGCHPGYPDRASMGRISPDSIPDEWQASVLDQVARFVALGSCEYVKPHGAWYNQIVAGHAGALSLLGEVERLTDLPVLILPVARRPKQIREGFADRGYTPDGTLLPRSALGAILNEPTMIESQLLRLAAEVDSLCVHGDGPLALETLSLARHALEANGYEVTSC